MTETNEAGTAFAEVAREHIEKLRPKVLDLTARNRLIATHFSERRHTHIRIVDELPGALLDKLESTDMVLDALPPLETDPPDEKNSRFRRALSEYYATDEIYMKALKSLEEQTLSDADSSQLSALVDVARGVALREIKPCWMVSRLTVAKYLPRIQGLFDLVVVEAVGTSKP